ncbi:hypothetical protein [Nitrospira sp.]|uniref:hypothetical protein n=1 Tax=Nitrospira sp. TaxID=70125 RepID=UPI003FCED86E
MKWCLARLAQAHPVYSYWFAGEAGVRATSRLGFGNKRRGNSYGPCTMVGVDSPDGNQIGKQRVINHGISREWRKSGRADDSTPTCTYQSLCHVHIKGSLVSDFPTQMECSLLIQNKNLSVDKCVLLRNLSVMVCQN